jgi:hypothetical protein
MVYDAEFVITSKNGKPQCSSLPLLSMLHTVKSIPAGHASP